MSEHVCDTGNFDRTLCAEPCGRMHSYCVTCGERQDPCDHDIAAPDETPRSTLAEDERAALADVWSARMVADRYVNLRDADEIADALLASGWLEKYVATRLAPLLAAARTAGVAQGRPTRVDPVHCVNAAFGRCASVEHKGDDCSLMYDERHPCTACHVERARRRARAEAAAAIKTEAERVVGVTPISVAHRHGLDLAARIAEGAEQREDA